MLSFTDLVCRRDERQLFAPVSMAAQAGDCIELLGPNGAGKTTLLRTLAGLHAQYDGRFRCEDFLFQGHRVGLDELMTPLENLRWYGDLQGVALGDESVRSALQKVGMAGWAFEPCQRLSQGQQRRVCMARWMLSQADTWLLDEPYTSLDTQGQQLLNDLLRMHCDDGGVVIAATHVPLRIGNPRRLQVEPLQVPRA